MASSCYAQLRQSTSTSYEISIQKNTVIEPVAQPEENMQTEQEKSCSIVQEALSEDDFFFDIEDEVCDANSTSCDELTGVLSRLQNLVKIFGVQAVLAALYLSEKVSGSYVWLVGYLNSLNKKA